MLGGQTQIFLWSFSPVDAWPAHFTRESIRRVRQRLQTICGNIQTRMIQSQCWGIGGRQIYFLFTADIRRTGYIITLTP